MLLYVVCMAEWNAIYGQETWGIKKNNFAAVGSGRPAWFDGRAEDLCGLGEETGTN